MSAATRSTAPQATASHARTVVLAALLAVVACGQVWTLVELAGARLLPAVALGIEGTVVVAAVLAAMRRRPESTELGRWWAIGVAVFLVWAAFYFAAARVTEPMHARTFDDAILERLPLLPEFAPIYLGVHVFGVVPFCVLPETRLLRRHLLGAVLIVVLSAIAWTALPVRLDRPPIPADATGFGAWLLRGVHEFDPTTNCFPSAHCAIAVYAAAGLRLARSRALFAWGIVTAVLICISTVMTRQHYVADVASGAVLAALCAYGTQRGARVR
ncbi:MAG: phosphatase PAP2 family protein [Labilithrix sp.]|nr:phosphatase PAP2 family protein [Labilithrix sp.]